MFTGFKEFITRGNVVELAVAVVIGAAFNAIITEIVAAVVTPAVALFFSAESLRTALQVTVPTLGGSTTTFAFGAVLAAVINFVAVALVVYFALIVPMNKRVERKKAKAGIPEEVPTPTQEDLLTEIRDLLAERRDR